MQTIASKWLSCRFLHLICGKKMPRRKSRRKQYIPVTADEELVMDEPSLYRAKWRGEPINVVLRSINQDGLYVVTSPPGKSKGKTGPSNY